jgi:hypothetical protein
MIALSLTKDSPCHVFPLLVDCGTPWHGGNVPLFSIASSHLPMINNHEDLA